MNQPTSWRAAHAEGIRRKLHLLARTLACLLTDWRRGLPLRSPHVVRVSFVTREL